MSRVKVDVLDSHIGAFGLGVDACFFHFCLVDLHLSVTQDPKNSLNNSDALTHIDALERR